MSFRLRLAANFAIIFSHIRYVDALLNNCFDPSGVQDFKIFACQPDATESACCAAGDICYSNGLCAPGPTENVGITPFFLDGCTDSSFTAPACIPNCLTIDGNGVQTCAGVGANHFCCYGFNGCNCSDPSQVFSLSAGTIVTTIDPSATYTASSSSTTSSLKATTTTTSSTSSTSASTPVSSSPSLTSTTPAATSSKSNNGVAIGVGVGVGLPVTIALAGLIFYFLYRRNATRERAELAATGNKDSPAFQEFYNSHEMQGYHPVALNELSEQRNSAYAPPSELPGHY